MFDPKTHKHRAIKGRSGSHSFFAPIDSALKQNLAAHGGVTIVDHCSCGNIRKSNVNGRHKEVGQWFNPYVKQY